MSSIEGPVAARVSERLQKVCEGRGPKDAPQAYAELDTKLAKDNAIASLTTRDGTEIIAFPGRTRPKPVRYGPFRENSSLDGVVIRIGGRGKTVPVLIIDAEGAEFSCQANVELSKRLAVHYRGATVRAHGSGRWVREESGTWTLHEFDIDNFEVLDDRPLMDVVAKLRAVEGGEWGKDTTLGDVLGLRREERTSH